MRTYRHYFFFNIVTGTTYIFFLFLPSMHVDSQAGTPVEQYRNTNEYSKTFKVKESPLSISLSPSLSLWIRSNIVNWSKAKIMKWFLLRAHSDDSDQIAYTCIHSSIVWPVFNWFSRSFLAAMIFFCALVFLKLRISGCFTQRLIYSICDIFRRSFLLAIHYAYAK